MTKVLMIRFGADGRPLQTVVIRTGGFGDILSKKEAVEQKAWELLEGITKELSLVPVDAEYVKEGGEYFLRCYIDKDGGVMIDDCEAVSRRLDPLLGELSGSWQTAEAAPRFCLCFRPRSGAVSLQGRGRQEGVYGNVDRQ